METNYEAQMGYPGRLLEFTARGGQVVRGVVSGIRKNVKVTTAMGNWTVSPGLLRPAGNDPIPAYVPREEP